MIPDKQRIIDGQKAALSTIRADNKSVKSLVSGISVSIRHGTNNLGHKTNFQKAFESTIAMTNAKVSVDHFLNKI